MFLYCTCTSQTLTIITLHLHDALAVVPMTKVEPFIRETKCWDMMISHRLHLKMSIYCCTHICFTLVRGTAAEVWKLNRHWGAAVAGGRSEEDHQAQRITAPLGGETGRISSVARCGRPQAGGSLRHGRIQGRTARVKDLKSKWRKRFNQEMQQICRTHVLHLHLQYIWMIVDDHSLRVEELLQQSSSECGGDKLRWFWWWSFGINGITKLDLEW